MLHIYIDSGDKEFFDEEKNEFVSFPKIDLYLEHSLLSLSKWESIWEKPYIPTSPNHHISGAEFKSYVECMVVGKKIDNYTLDIILAEKGSEIINYINSPGCAKINYRHNNSKGPILITATVIYYWLLAYQIPFETAEKWHLNRLLHLIEVCNEKSKKKETKPLTTDQILARNAENERRKKEYGLRG